MVDVRSLAELHEALTLKDVGRMLGVSRRTLYRMIERGQLHAFKTSSQSWRITREGIEQFIKTGGVASKTTLNPVKLDRSPRQAFSDLLRTIHENGDVVTNVRLDSSDGRCWWLPVVDQGTLTRSPTRRSAKRAHSPQVRKPRHQVVDFRGKPRKQKKTFPPKS